MKSFLSLLLALPVVFAEPTINRRQTSETIPGKWIAEVNQDSLLANILTTIETLAGVSARHKYEIGNFKGFSFSGDDRVLDLLQSVGAIKSIEPDKRVYTNGPVSQLSECALTSQKPSTWGLGRISHRAKGSNVYVYNSNAGSNTDIYIVDTGIFVDHSDFGGRARMGANFVEGESSTDGNGHGTHCAGTTGSNTYGVAKEAKIIGVKVLGSDGSGTNSDVIAGIQWAVNNANSSGRTGRSVISMSLGGQFDQTSNNAVAQAVAAGVFVAVAAGNDGRNAANYSPASESSACTVGATDIDDNRASFSNFGSILDIFAPGVNIQSTWIGSSTATNTISGTSMATPHIAGLAAYLIALEGPRSPSALCSRIQALSTKNVVVSPGSGSPNCLAYNGNRA
ncbi:subtilisin-like protein [Dothistroma septosporum NZE10]|uniref:Subtilisin-like protein n=1 Tax=Dothistroma septosporum (strain NZE10 / CBS 128990) TaxID=675120 RepID=N1PBQ3_DOTSN|nr:subtilisin-like protein [Dothistroma septosporum NZE10]